MVKRQGQPQQSLQAKLEPLDVIKPNACGIDIGARSHWVSVPPAQDPQPVREFSCYTPDLAAMVAWLKECRIETVAMEPFRSILDSGISDARSSRI
jgi:transposase